jgi:NUDIX domain
MSNYQSLPKIHQHRPLIRFAAALTNSPICYVLRIVAPIIWRDPRPRSRVLILCNGHALLVRNLGSTGKWTLPGGGAKAYESFAQAALREVKEELSIHIPPKELVFLKQYAGPLVHTRFDKVCFAFTFLRTDSPVMLSYEIIEAAWHPIDDLPSDASLVVHHAVRDYAKLHVHAATHLENTSASSKTQRTTI